MNLQLARTIVEAKEREEARYKEALETVTEADKVDNESKSGVTNARTTV